MHKTPVLSHQQPKGHDFQFKVDASLWSQVSLNQMCEHYTYLLSVDQPINLEPPSAEISAVMPSGNQKSEALVGLSWTEGGGKYKLSKVVTLAPRFIICNKLDRHIKFRQHTDVTGSLSELAPGERRPVIQFRPSEERLLTFAYPGLDAQW